MWKSIQSNRSSTPANTSNGLTYSDDILDILITKTLNEDGSPMEEDTYSSSYGRGSLMDKYEYVMNGIVFKFVEDTAKKGYVSVIASFGGLLLMVYGKQDDLKNFVMDDRIFLLIRKA